MTRDFFLQGRAQLERGEYDAAVGCFTQACGRQPGNRIFHGYRAWAMFCAARLRRELCPVSIESYRLQIEKAVRCNPRFVDGQLFLARIAMYVEDLPSAETHLEDAIRLEPDHREARRLMLDVRNRGSDRERPRRQRRALTDIVSGFFDNLRPPTQPERIKPIRVRSFNRRCET